MIKTRSTKYVLAVQNFVGKQSHVTNHDILIGLKADYPNLTATTVHRVTDRLIKTNKLYLAPANYNNAMRFDSNLVAHDHFKCQNCDKLKDVKLPPSIVHQLEKLIIGCKINGSLTISGLCNNCFSKNDKKERELI